MLSWLRNMVSRSRYRPNRGADFIVPVTRYAAVDGFWGWFWGRVWEMIRKPKNVANEIDAHVGSRLRLRRLLLGISQEKLGKLPITKLLPLQVHPTQRRLGA